MDLEVEAEGLVDGGGEDGAVPAVLEGADEAARGEEDLEDAALDATGLGVGADEGPGGAARALGGVEHLLPPGADHLSVSRGVAGRAGGGGAGARGGRRRGGARHTGALLGRPLSPGSGRCGRCRGRLGGTAAGLHRGVPVDGDVLRRGLVLGAGRGVREVTLRSAGVSLAARAAGDLGGASTAPALTVRVARSTGGGSTALGGALPPGGSRRRRLPRGRSSTGSTRGALARDEESGHEELELEARRGGPDHLGEGLGRHVRGAGEAGGTDRAGLDLHAGELVLRQGAQRGPGLGAGERDDEEVSQALEEVLDEAPRVVPRGDDAVHHAEDPGAVGRGDRIDALVEHGRVRVAEERDGALVVDLAVDGAADELVHDGEGVAHGASAGAGDEREDSRADLHALGLAQVAEVALEDVRRDEPEGVVVGAGADGPDDLLRLGGREDELDVSRGLLDELEQGVEALGGDHVGLVEDEDLEAVPGRGEGGALAQVAGVVDAVVAGGVDLDDVEAAGAAGREVPAGGALAAGGVRRVLLAVEATGEDTGGGGLAAAARAGEEIGVGDLVRAQRRHERGGHVVLPDDVLEGVWAVAAVQGGGHGPTLNGAHDTVRGCLATIRGRTLTRPGSSGCALERRDPPCTRQSPLTLATFRSWGIHWMTPHEGPGESVPDGGAAPARSPVTHG